MTHTEIIKKLIGSVRPVGESNTDNQRLSNLKDMCKVAEDLIEEIYEVASIHHNGEHSIKEAKKTAQDFLTSINDQTK